MSTLLLEPRNYLPRIDAIWAEWFERAERRIALDEVAGAVISTVFLGVNHQWGDGPPLVFETLVSGGQLDGEMDRYSTWDEAAAGHVAMCVKVKLAEAGETVANA
jgi:hypothetical protein